MFSAVSLLLLCVGISVAPDLFFSSFPLLKVHMNVKLTQIDASGGEVYGVSNDSNIYHWVNNSWRQVPGELIHVTFGPAGLWGVNRENIILKMQDNNWMNVSGFLKQVDAGGDIFLGGVNAQDNVYCLDQSYIVSGSSCVTFTPLDGDLKYYSCGPESCWGVNRANNIYYRHNVSSMACQGTQWEQVEGSLEMLEVGTDGLVFGVDSEGHVLRREGITAENPVGYFWVPMSFSERFKHVSYDNGSVWLISQDDEVYLSATNPTLWDIIERQNIGEAQG
ncbi:fish-egg lectin-like [Rana temporaria]|uniref:fish-egg lectin-like n=1 Tax=Rana temporaria TaxID=8407 RepID=UPI001AACD706|nr:fish-egg lectin-like [Rana temporaria]